MLLDDVTTGPSNDLQVSTALARDMVTKYGMSENLGPVALEGAGGKALFGRGVNEKEYSEEVSALIDKEVSKIMKEGLQRATEVLTKYGSYLETIAQKLIKDETLEQEEFYQIVKAIIPPEKQQAPEFQPVVENGAVVST